MAYAKIRGRKDNENEYKATAIEHLSHCRSQIEDAVIPCLESMLILSGDNVKNTPFYDQTNFKISVLRTIASYANDAINVIQNSGKDIVDIDSVVTLEDLFRDVSMNREIAEFAALGIASLYRLESIEPPVS